LTEVIEKMLGCGVCFGKKASPVQAPSAASALHAPLDQPMVDVVLSAYDSYDFGGSADAITAWLNGRWKKTGFSVSTDVVCFTLRMHGRDARMGLPDPHHGDFYRPLPTLQAQAQASRNSLLRWVDAVLADI
jgi:hypothetical protein